VWMLEVFKRFGIHCGCHLEGECLRDGRVRSPYVGLAVGNVSGGGGVVASNMELPRGFFVVVHYGKNKFTKDLYLQKICNRTSLYGPTAGGAGVDPSSHVCSSPMLVLPA
jgi:hypothetical protein